MIGAKAARPQPLLDKSVPFFSGPIGRHSLSPALYLVVVESRVAAACVSHAFTWESQICSGDKSCSVVYIAVVYTEENGSCKLFILLIAHYSRDGDTREGVFEF